jgi:hypothetical protein
MRADLQTRTSTSDQSFASEAQASIATALLEHPREPRLIVVQEPYDRTSNRTRNNLVLCGKHATEAHPFFSQHLA